MTIEDLKTGKLFLDKMNIIQLSLEKIEQYKVKDKIVYPINYFQLEISLLEPILDNITEFLLKEYKECNRKINEL